MPPSRDSPSQSTGGADSTPDPAAPSESSTAPAKIAIKGFSLSSKSTASTSASPSSSTTKSSIQLKQSRGPTPVLGKRPRNNAFHHGNHDDDEEDIDGHHGRHELVTGFADGSATKHEDRRAKKEPLVIERQGNRDWRAEIRMRRPAGKNLLPPEVQAQRAAAAAAAQGGGNAKIDGVDVVNGGEGPKWGLNIKEKKTVVEEKPEGEVKTETKTEITTQSAEVGGSNGVDPSATIDDVAQSPPRPKTDDELALEALMGTQSKKKGPDLIIPVTSEEESGEGAQFQAPISETDAYRRAIQEAPDVSTLEDYERVPVEEFGAALLRGMGWKGEKISGPREVKRRQNLLGLGASHLKDAEELGAWVQKSDTKRLKGSESTRYGSGDRRPKASEYKSEKERERARRDERHGESYRRERDRSRERERDRNNYRDRDRHRDYRR